MQPLQKVEITMVKKKGEILTYNRPHNHPPLRHSKAHIHPPHTHQVRFDGKCHVHLLPASRLSSELSLSLRPDR
eukprot:m.121972 g.121972  ORF g.121972 m.121972 type:complete len:74 (-) comp28893_c1_seq1:117-338(-)